MILPCIDLMGGQVVQLVQGQELALTRPLEEMLIAFAPFDLIHVIDLDAAMRKGSNAGVVAQILGTRKARVGGGVRTVERARELVEMGAEQVIVGSRALSESGPDLAFMTELVQAVGRERVIVALDVRSGGIAVDGWKRVLPGDPGSLFRAFEPHCAGFLCTHVDREGMLQGADLELFARLRAATDHTLIAAGGVTTLAEVEHLAAAGIDVALGMAIYTGKIALGDLQRLNRATQR